MSPFPTVSLPSDTARLAKTGLTSPTIPNSVATIGSFAFSFRSSLTSVTIPASVTNVGSGAFAACFGLTAITVDPANSFFSSANGVLFDKNQTTLIEFPAGRGRSYTIPASVTSIGYEAFDAVGAWAKSIQTADLNRR